MILVDTSIWIDHLHKADTTLVDLLEAGEVVTHSCVIGEMACGSLSHRDRFLAQLRCLPMSSEAGSEECLFLVETHHLFGKGLSWTDVQILASALLSGAKIWTHDKPLRHVALTLGASFPEIQHE